MKKLSDKARLYARKYGQPPYGREIEGTAELLLQMAEKLEKYEDLEEQGKLLRLPCAVGDIAYRINKGAKKLIAMRIRDIKIFQVGGILSMKIGCVEDIYGGECNYPDDEIGKIVFLSKEEAEIALKERAQ
ncbi:hypothetical protein [Bacteroides acidifaciens]|uniref:hypothetical protein n=1 Tax=Bacteroides acidifaciens TaxID=85831 RepID=UPI0025B2754C|nr:hypothetical protein [Bacteroides acidifaciens]